jgi:uncharacterized membrane protein YkvA (DUF1232 family)
MIQKSPLAKRSVIKKRRISFIQEIFLLYYGMRDGRTPFYAKVTALSAIIYLISPIDLIPDFIPVAGYLDDLVIVPILLHVAFNFLPSDVKESASIKARKHMVTLYISLTIIFLVIIGFMAWIFYVIKSLLHLW